MKKDWLVVILSTVLTVVIAVGLIRWLAPELLGYSSDRLVVRASREVPPFYENAFRVSDSESTEFLINDPYTKVRGMPFFPDMGSMGPNDLLGFRNRAVPHQADIITIGDSQTYGNNAILEQNWPSSLRQQLDLPAAFRHYSMAIGGWGAPQYYYAFMKSTFLDPRLVVVAFYTGNDPMESFSVAYAIDLYRQFRPDPKLRLSDIPPGPGFPPPPEHTWPVTFPDGTQTVFTPDHRNYSNFEHPVVDAGYEIMARAAEAIADFAAGRSIHVVFTIIPTKELAYSKKVDAAGIEVMPEYAQLVANEEARIRTLAGRLSALRGAAYVDVVDALQHAVQDSTALLYPQEADGHPLAAGYQVIATALAPEVERRLTIPEPLLGAWAVRMPNDTVEFHVVNDEGRWRFNSPAVFEANGWDLNAEVAAKNLHEFGQVPFRGPVQEINPQRFGPRD